MDDIIAGFPALETRALLRRWKDGASPLHIIAGELDISTTDARAVLRALIAEDLVAEVNVLPRREVRRFELTVKGRAFAQASGAKPLRRKTVEKRLSELVERMVYVNDANEFLVGVEDAYVYGSFLTDAKSLGDLDISLRFYRKETDPERFMELEEQSVLESGRHFSTDIEKWSWPEKKVLLFLKKRSRVFSLHVDEPLLTQDISVPRRAVFSKRRPVDV